MSKKFVWYDICNDYSLEVREMPARSELHESAKLDDGVVFFNEHQEAVFLLAPAGLTQIDDFDDFGLDFS